MWFSFFRRRRLSVKKIKIEICKQRGLEALPIMLCIWTISSFFRSRDYSFCYGFHWSRVTNCSHISQKKAYLSLLFWSRSKRKCSAGTIPLSSSEIVLGHVSFPEKNCLTKDVRIYISGERNKSSESSSESSSALLEVMNSCDIKLNFSTFYFLVCQLIIA